ncbi:hypothetical protein [Halocatena salina]|uniref:Uncharacterized protein n=1 Tax=Halocatena salina TaxID=2934340 RepID=A0A8U0A5S3_9EURY|nr:hypothetical protein [Halocatena salina]UPM44540.1 hypothetical protein MW046_14015 [Halocatena salina]
METSTDTNNNDNEGHPGRLQFTGSQRLTIAGRTPANRQTFKRDNRP